MKTDHPTGPFCQSCGMPLQAPGDFGTEKGGAPSADYCVYCYKEGAFIDPAITQEEMTAFVIDFMVKQLTMEPDKADTLVRGMIPHLARWRTP